MRVKKVFKFMYETVPFKKQIFLFVKKFWKPDERIYRHLHFGEPFSVAIDEGRSFRMYNGTQIENEIFWEGLTGRWERQSMQLWISLSQKSRCIFDIGANNGVYALVAKTLSPHASVFAFEPHPVFFSNLVGNIRLNRYDISCHQKAVSDAAGVITIEDYTGRAASIEVESVTLDAFIETHRLEQVDLLKIDVETFEPNVLRGFRNSLKRFRPTMLIEILNDEVATSVSELVSGLGYLYFNIDEKGGIRQTKQVEKSDFYNYLICQESIAKETGLMDNDV